MGELEFKLNVQLTLGSFLGGEKGIKAVSQPASYTGRQGNSTPSKGLKIR